MKISFKSLVTSPHETRSLDVCYGIVNNEKIKIHTEELCRVYGSQIREGFTKEEKRAYQEYKKKHFPVVMFSLNDFDRDSDKKILPGDHTGRLNLDLDENSKEELDTFFATIDQFPFIEFCALSVSGGISGHRWANVRIEIPESSVDLPEQLQEAFPGEIWLESLHKLYFEYVAAELRKTGITVGSVKDLKRARYIGFDKAPYHNREAAPLTPSQLFPLLASKQAQEHEKPHTEQVTHPRTASDHVIKATIDTLSANAAKELDDREQFVNFCMACKQEGLSFADVDKMVAKSAGYDRTGNEKIWEGLKPNGSKTFGSAVKLAKSVNEPFFRDRLKYYKAVEQSADEEIPEGLGIASQMGIVINKLCTPSYSTLTDKIHINDKPLTDKAFSWLFCKLVDKGFKNMELTRQVLLLESCRRQFHPVQKYFNGLKWDGKERLDFETISTYVKDKDDIFPHILRKFMIGVIAKAFHGWQNPMMVLVGVQGKGKSQFARWLCPLKGFYLEQAISPDSKDDNIRLTEKLIWEAAELGSTTRRQDVEALKAFLTREMVSIRRPYDRFDVERMALASFIGTINDDGGGFLNDVTGNRRFRVAHLESIDWAYTQELDLLQMWAEAVHLWREGETIVMGEDAGTLMKDRIKANFEVTEPLEEYIQECFVVSGDEDEFVKTIDIIKAIYDSGYKGKSTRSDSMVLSKVAHGLGLQKVRVGAQRGFSGLHFRGKGEPDKGW